MAKDRSEPEEVWVKLNREYIDGCELDGTIDQIRSWLDEIEMKYGHDVQIVTDPGDGYGAAPSIDIFRCRLETPEEVKDRLARLAKRRLADRKRRAKKKAKARADELFKEWMP